MSTSSGTRLRKNQNAMEAAAPKASWARSPRSKRSTTRHRTNAPPTRRSTKAARGGFVFAATSSRLTPSRADHAARVHVKANAQAREAQKRRRSEEVGRPEPAAQPFAATFVVLSVDSRPAATYLTRELCSVGRRVSAAPPPESPGSPSSPWLLRPFSSPSSFAGRWQGSRPRQRHDWLTSLASSRAASTRPTRRVFKSCARSPGAAGCPSSSPSPSSLGPFDERHLRALLEVPREHFVRAEDIERSADDTPLPLDSTGLATISAPARLPALVPAPRPGPGRCARRAR